MTKLSPLLMSLEEHVEQSDLATIKSLYKHYYITKDNNQLLALSLCKNRPDIVNFWFEDEARRSDMCHRINPSSQSTTDFMKCFEDLPENDWKAAIDCFELAKIKGIPLWNLGLTITRKSYSEKATEAIVYLDNKMINEPLIFTGEFCRMGLGSYGNSERKNIEIFLRLAPKLWEKDKLAVCSIVISSFLASFIDEKDVMRCLSVIPDIKLFCDYSFVMNGNQNIPQQNQLFGLVLKAEKLRNQIKPTFNDEVLRPAVTLSKSRL